MASVSSAHATAVDEKVLARADGHVGGRRSAAERGHQAAHLDAAAVDGHRAGAAAVALRDDVRGRADAHRRLGDREHEEDWKAWWDAATADPELAGPAAERARRRLSEDHHGSESVLLVQHVAALRAAGFAEIGTLWQYGENRILCAVTPA